MKKGLLTMALAAVLSLASAARDQLDYDALYRMKEEGLQRSQVMETTSWLTDVHGPLTGSPNIRAAAGWADAEEPPFNVIAEIPGTDKAAELVMLGAHFDSWHAGTGATDNAAGSAVMMEAMRILKAAGLKPRRTVRMALWSGEENGLLGSRAYVKNHFADPETMQLKPEHARLSGYFNVDNGTARSVVSTSRETRRPSLCSTPGWSRSATSG